MAEHDKDEHRSSSHRDRDRDRDSHHSSSSRKHERSSSSRHHSSSHRDSSSRHKEEDRSDSKRHRSSHHSSSSSSRSKEKRHRSRSPASERKNAVTSTANGAYQPDPPASGPPIDTYGTFSVRDSRPMVGDAALQPLSSAALTDGYGEGENGSSSSAAARAEDDLFGSMGVARAKKEKKELPDPTASMGQSSRELNKAHWQPHAAPAAVAGSSAAASAAPSSASPAPGSTGSGWRMSKLKRTFEVAEEEGRPIEDVALERYGDLATFEEAKEERRILDERGGGRRGPGGGGRPSFGGASAQGTPSGRAPLPPPRAGAAVQTPTEGGRRFIYTDIESAASSSANSRPGSRAGFRRPGEQPPTPAEGQQTPSAANSRPSTPVPRMFAPTPPASHTPRPVVPSSLSRSSVVAPADEDSYPNGAAEVIASSKPVLSQSELNKLQAKVLKAKLMGGDNADKLEAEYEAERKRAQEAPLRADREDGPRTDVQVMPTLDGRGRLYDIGTGRDADPEPGKRKKEKAFVSHDPKTGEVIARSADDDGLSIEEMVRQERFSAGSRDHKDADAAFAARIAGDARYKNDLDYADENAERLARAKMKSDTMKKAFAINDYARTKKALDNCTLCYPESGGPPRAGVIALGTRAYLGLTETEPLTEGHCRIVPIQHQFSTLDADDETWDEIRNFMKTLMAHFGGQDKGVVFFESAISLKAQKHTVIEAIPVPFELFDELPGYFQEGILASETEWSQHKKLISFSNARPFRRSLVSNLPYFMVQFDYKGEKGYGHVVEGVDDAPERDADGDEIRGDFGESGGGEFPRWFAQEIIGNLLDLPPKRWRKPHRIDTRKNKERVDKFRQTYDKFDWTKAIGKDEA